MSEYDRTVRTVLIGRREECSYRGDRCPFSFSNFRSVRTCIEYERGTLEERMLHRYKCDWVNDWVNEWMNEWMNEWKEQSMREGRENTNSLVPEVLRAPKARHRFGSIQYKAVHFVLYFLSIDFYQNFLLLVRDILP